MWFRLDTFWFYYIQTWILIINQGAPRLVGHISNKFMFLLLSISVRLVVICFSVDNVLSQVANRTAQALLRSTKILPYSRYYRYRYVRTKTDVERWRWREGTFTSTASPHLPFGACSFSGKLTVLCVNLRVVVCNISLQRLMLVFTELCTTQPKWLQPNKRSKTTLFLFLQLHEEKRLHAILTAAAAAAAEAFSNR